MAVTKSPTANPFFINIPETFNIENSEVRKYPSIVKAEVHDTLLVSPFH